MFLCTFNSVSDRRMNVERQWNVSGGRIPKYLEITCRIDTLYLIDVLGLQSGMGLLGERLATNRLNHGTDQLFVYFNSVLIC